MEQENLSVKKDFKKVTSYEWTCPFCGHSNHETDAPKKDDYIECRVCEDYGTTLTE